MGGNNEFFENFERDKYLKKLPSMQRVKTGLSACVLGRKNDRLPDMWGLLKGVPTPENHLVHTTQETGLQ